MTFVVNLYDEIILQYDSSVQHLTLISIGSKQFALRAVQPDKKINKKNPERVLCVDIVVVVLVHICPPVTGQRQTPTTIGRSAHFSLQWLLRARGNWHLLRSFQRSNVNVDFFEFLSTNLLVY